MVMFMFVVSVSVFGQNTNQTQTGYFLNAQYTNKMGGEFFFSSDTGSGVSGTSYGARLDDIGQVNGGIKPHVTIGKGIAYTLRPTSVRFKYWLIYNSQYHSLIRFAFAIGNDSGSTYWNSTSPNQDLGATQGFQTVTFPVGSGGVLNCNQFFMAFHSPLTEGNNLHWLFYFDEIEILVNNVWIPIDGGTGTAQIPPTPMFLNPPIGHVFYSLPACFDWQQVSGLTYQFQTAGNPEFTNLLINQTVVGSSFCINSLPNGYYWAGLKARYTNQPSWALSGRGVRNFGIQIPTGINQNGTGIPKEFNLHQNYPNPFNPVTNIKFDIPQKGNVKLAVYDITGKEVEILLNENMNPGSYTADFDASALASGVYFYKLQTDSYANTKKMMLVK